MRSASLFGLACAASMAVASPLKQLHKKAYKYEIVTDIVWVTVTAGYLPTAPVTTAKDTTVVISSTVYAPVPEYVPSSSSSSSSSSTSVAPVVIPTSTYVAPVPTVIPTTSSEPPVVVVPTPSAPPVVPTTSSTPVAVPTTTSEPVVVSKYPASSTAAAGLATPTDFISAALYHHNVHRANHSAVALTYDATIAGYAQQLTDTCNYGHDVTIGGGGYGQNIASYGSTGADSITELTIMGAVASNMWYNSEVDLFADFYGQDNPTSNFEGWGHFTQMVWKDTTTVGCGITLCAAGTIFDGLAAWYVACNYESAGNVAGEYATNVGAPLAGSDSTISVAL